MFNSNSLIALMVRFLQVVTQYYRAPELLAGATHYGQEGMFDRKDEVVPTLDSAYLAYKGVSYLLTYMRALSCMLLYSTQSQKSRKCLDHVVNFFKIIFSYCLSTCICYATSKKIFVLAQNLHRAPWIS